MKETGNAFWMSVPRQEYNSSPVSTPKFSKLSSTVLFFLFLVLGISLSAHVKAFRFCFSPVLILSLKSHVNLAST